MQAVLQLNITMPNIPSSLAKVGDKLRAANVNIGAINCTEGTTHTIIHLIVDDPETAKIVLAELGPVTVSKVLAFKVKNAPGAIASIGRAFAAANLNIRSVFSTTFGKEAMAYVTVNDIEKAIEALRSWEDGMGKMIS
jgi:hypothetical protein